LKKSSGVALLFHIIAWILFFLAPLFLSPGPVWDSVSTEGILSLLARNFILMALFYFNFFYLTPVVLKKNGTGYYFALLILLIAVVSFFNAGFHQHLTGNGDFGTRPPPPPEERPYGPGPERRRPPLMLASPDFSSLLITILVVATSTLLVLWEDWSRAQAEKKEQVLQKVAAELTALKLQISPHFLFNTLNNIRWLIRSKSENAEDAVVTLSHLLRYILYQTESDQVDLEKEVQHLNDFIDLQKMRLPNLGAIRITVEGDWKGKKIVPLLLLPLVENFFKHGDFTQTNQNSILLVVKGDGLIFKSSNRITMNETGGRGIGLDNLKKRLALHYPERYSLKYFEKNLVFNLELELQLSSI
jgi:hypothetical protein